MDIPDTEDLPNTGDLPSTPDISVSVDAPAPSLRGVLTSLLTTLTVAGTLTAATLSLRETHPWAGLATLVLAAVSIGVATTIPTPEVTLPIAESLSRERTRRLGYVFTGSVAAGLAVLVGAGVLVATVSLPPVGVLGLWFAAVWIIALLLFGFPYGFIRWHS